MPTCPHAMHIHRRLLPVKATYFFTLAAVGSLLPYLSVYMKQVGLSATETAIIYGVMPFLGALIRPVFGACADKLQQHKAVLMLCCISAGVLHASLLFVPSAVLPSQNLLNLTCNENGTILSTCNINSGEKLCSSSLRRHLDSSDIESDISYSNSSCQLQCYFMSQNMTNNICLEDNSVTRCDNISGITTNHDQLQVMEFKIDTEFSKSDTGNESLLCASQAYAVNNKHSKLLCLSEEVFQCEVDCDSDDLQNAFDSCQDDVPYEMFGSTFVMFFIIYLFAQIAFSSVISLIDAMAYDYLGDDRAKWGEQRLWGTIGFASFAIISSLYMDVFGTVGNKNYTAAFILFGVNNVLAAVAVCVFEISNEVSCSNMMANLKDALRVPQIVSLLVVVFVFGIYQGVVETFLFWHLQTLGSSQLLLGICMVVNCVPEILVFSVSGRLIKALGHIACMSVVFVAWAVRFLTYSFLTNAWMALIVEPLHGITFALMYAEASSYGSRIAPPGMQATIQGLVAGLHFGFGKGVGSVSAGQVLEHFGTVVMFQSYATSAMVMLVLYWITCAVIKRYSTPVQKETEESTVNGRVSSGTKEGDGADEVMMNTEDTEMVRKDEVTEKNQLV